VTNPIHDPPEPWRLVLTEGELLEVRPALRTDTKPQVVLTLPPWRALDIATTLGRYNRVAAIFADSRDPMTEESLVRALSDAHAVALGPFEPLPSATKVTSEQRGSAMVVLQRGRPELSHDQLVAVVDAAAWLLDTHEYDKASDLLRVSASDEAAMHALQILEGFTPPEQDPQ
jgi:hypothetical protein